MAKRRSAKEIAYTEAQFALLDARSKIDDAVEALELAIVALQAEIAKLRAVVEAARVLNATLHVTEGGLYKMVDVADDVGCSNLGGTSYEEHPDVEGAMERMTAALAALDDKGAT